MIRARETNQTTCHGAVFATTMWSVVLAAGDEDKPGSEQALERLCQNYWPPIYAYLRRAGHSPADAEDLTQGFLASLMSRKSFASVGPERGRFRSFLLASLGHFISDQRDRANALKRGGGRRVISLDAETAEGFYARQATNGETPERAFERDWAESILERAQTQLNLECERAGKGALYHELAPGDGERSRSHAEIALAHGISENAVRLAAFRLRQRYRELVRAEIRCTVNSEAELDEEIRHLLQVFSQ